MSEIINLLLKKYPIVSDQIEKDELAVILTELETVIDSGVDGDVVEFGCFSGTTSLFIQRLLMQKNSNKKFYVYDSFDGLPDKSKEDESPLGIDFRRGELRSTKADFIHNFRKANLPLPIITKKWFHEVEDDDVPNRVAFAFLDGDYYKSIRSSLAIVVPRMSQGGIIVIDDYDNPALPGAKKALFAATIGTKISYVKCSLAVVKV